MEGFRIKQAVRIFICALQPLLTPTHVPQLPPGVEQDVAGGEEELAYGTHVRPLALSVSI